MAQIEKIFREQEGFYDRLQDIKTAAVTSSTRWAGAYLVTTYTLPNGEVWEYWNDMDYGIVYGLERVG